MGENIFGLWIQHENGVSTQIQSQIMLTFKYAWHEVHSSGYCKIPTLSEIS